MKSFYLTFLILFCVVSIVFPQAEQATTPPYEGYQIDVTPMGEHYWVYGKGGRHGLGLYHDFNGWKFIGYDIEKYGKAIDITGEYGSIAIRTDKDKVLRWNSNNKVWFENKGISNIKDFVYYDNNVYILGTVKQPDGSTKTGIFSSRGTGSSSSSWTPIYTAEKLNRFDIIETGKHAGWIVAVKANTGDFCLISKVYENYGIRVLPLPGSPRLKDVYVSRDKIYIQSVSNDISEVILGPPLNLNKIKSTTTAGSWAVSDAKTLYRISGTQIERFKAGKALETLNAPNPNRIVAGGYTPLTKAVMTGQPAEINRAIEEGADLNYRDANGDVALLIALNNPYTKSYAETLIKAGADVNVSDKNGYSALYWACKHRQNNNIKLMLDKGADPNQKGITEMVINSYRPEIIKMFLQKNVDLSSGFVTAAKENNVKMFETLSKAGVKQNGLNAFKEAVYKDHREIAAMSIDYGVNVNEATKFILESNRKEFIPLCLEKGANPQPVVDYAVTKNDIETSNILVSLPNVGPDKMLSAALNTKSGPARIEIAELSLQKGADPNKHIKNAVSSDQNATVNLLLKYGANPQTLLVESVNSNKSKFAQLAIDQGAIVSESKIVIKAIDHKNKGMVEMLINAGGNPSDPVLISKSVANNDLPITELLLNKGASATDPSLIKTAVTNKKVELSRLLVSNGATCTDPELISIAVNGDDLETSKLLIENGASASDPGLIKAAVKSNNSKLAQLLLDNGAPVTVKGLVSDAAERNNPDIVFMLVEKGADPNDGVAMAVSKNNTKIASYLFDKGADATTPKLMAQASGFGNMVLVKKIFEYGGDVNNGTLSAIKGSKVEVLKFLIENGALMSTPEYMYHAVATNNESIFLLVESSGAPNTWEDKNGNNLLHVLASKENASSTIINHLAKGDVDINAINKNGDTPLLITVVVGKNNIQGATSFLEAGADINIPNRDGKTPRKMAKGLKLKRFLKKNGGIK
ncbi:MAG: hypothetical protein C0593_01365 [Marinilabiliales bacterium]|nr:MAG: hypothetical protein C0593_01365 [Marinilabiliales bacterium]